jgi:hypothetical protein
LKRKVSIILISILAFIGLSSCTPEQMQVWNSLNPVQQQQVVDHVTGNQSYQALGKTIATEEKGYTEADFQCLDNVIQRESAWYNVPNAAGGKAYGIPQALPGSKMQSHGPDWRTNPVTQIRWLLDYVEDRYGTPCAAWNFKSKRGWY